jgi:gliding motility-associated-like protein
MKALASVFFLLVVLSCDSMAQDLEWARSFGGSAYDIGSSITEDFQGNVISVGHFSGIVDADPNAGISTINSSKGGLFISKLDPKGKVIWVKSIDIGNGTESLVSTDQIGNIYVTSAFQDTVDFDPSPNEVVKISNRKYEIFILKLDSNGNFQWVKTLDNTGSGSHVTAISLEDENSIILMGRSIGETDYDPGENTYFLDNKSGNEYFVLKLTMNGDFVWVKQTELYIADVCVSSSGNVFLTGSYSDSIDFDFGPNESIVRSPGGLFILKLNSLGEYQWHKTLEGSCRGQKINVDDSGNLYLLSYFRNTLEFEVKGKTRSLRAKGYDFLLVKFDNIGNIQWYKHIDGKKYQSTMELATDKYGNTVCAGRFSPTSKIINGNESDSLTSIGHSDIFIAKFNTYGETQWFHRLGNSNEEKIKDIYLNDSGIIYTTGGFFETLDFDLTEKEENRTSLGSFDVFIQKLESCNSVSRLESTLCFGDSLEFNGHKIFESGEYQDTLVNALGCDSLVILQLRALPFNEHIDTITVCDSFTWVDDVTYFSDTSLSYVAKTSQGCDSIVTLQLDFLPFSESYDTITACKNFIWLDNVTYFSDTSISYVAKTILGCDSTIYLNLTIENCSFNVFIPNAFSPNNDGLNDRFKPSGERIESYEMSIYSRWGELIYKSSDPNGWDGADAQAGIYLYDIRIVGNDGKEPLRQQRSGIVHLLR